MKRSTKILTGILVGVNALVGVGFALQSLPVEETDASGYSTPHSWWYNFRTPTTTWRGTASTDVDSQIDAHARNTTDIWQQQQSRHGWDTRQNAFVNPTAIVDVDSSINARSTNNGGGGWTGYPYNPSQKYGYGSANYCLYHSCSPVWHGGTSNGSSTTNVDSDINASAVNNTEIWQQQQSGGSHWGSSPWQSAIVEPTATVNVDSSITANSNNGSGWGYGYGSTSTNVDSDIDATAVNNTVVWQQQQSGSPFGVGQTAIVEPTATVNVNSHINANSGW